MPKELPASIFRTPKLRMSYPALHTARAAGVQKPGEPPPEKKFGSTFILDAVTRADPTYKDRMVVLANAVALKAKARWPDEFAQVEMPWLDNGAFHSPWLDGNLPKYRAKGGLGEDTRFIRTSSKRRIPTVGRNGLPMDTDEPFYPGCYVYALVTVFDYSNPQSHGVSFGLRGVQFAQDGERLDDSVDVSDAFGALEGDDVAVGGGLENLQALFGGS